MKRLGTGGLLWRLSNHRHCAVWWNQEPPAFDAGECQIVGAVRHPGVYTLPASARVYQLLQAAGGPLPNADLVALNMAAKLSDGQEVYVAVNR